MTKTVLIITSRAEKTVAWQERERYVQEFCEQVESALENVRVAYTTFRDLHYEIHNGQACIYDTKNKWDLKDVSLVHFKNWQYEIHEAPVVAHYLTTHGVAFFNSEVGMPMTSGKLAQMFMLATAGIPVPDTLYATKEQLKTIFSEDSLVDWLTYPLIMKAEDGSRGDDNYLIHNAKEAQDILAASAPEKEYILQNFIPNDGDYRFLYIGLDDAPIVFHRKGVEGSHLNNTSKGGAGQFVGSEELPSEYLSYARRAAEILGKEIGGVDILVDKNTNRPYVLEVNGTPALATGYGVSTKADRFAAFVRQVLEVQEEE